MKLKTLKEIKQELSTLDSTQLKQMFNLYADDSRVSVHQLIENLKKKIEKEEIEKKRIEYILKYEKECYEKGNQYIVGIDEVGRGPLAGPVLVGAVILPKDCRILGVKDSKKLSENKREELDIKIREVAIDISTCSVDVDTIDKINILQATYKAMKEAILQLKIKPDTILVDALKIPNIDIEQVSIIAGDNKSLSIGAASIVAKVERDKIMIEAHKLYPQYGFDRNKGYGTQEHIKAIKKYGLCPIHRKTFVKNFIEC